MKPAEESLIRLANNYRLYPLVTHIAKSCNKPIGIIQSILTLMFKYLPFVFKNILQNNRWTILAIRSVTVSLFLLDVLPAVYSALYVHATECEFRLIAIASQSKRPVTPCGVYHQFLWKFCEDIEIVLSNLNGFTEMMQLPTLILRPFDASFL